MTVLFCDLVGSTTLSAQLDPEELWAVVQTYQQPCAAVIRRYEGYIAQYLGDGVWVYCGYPVAHEDDAQQAVRTGLEIITALAKQVRSPPQGFSPSPFQGEGWGEGSVSAQFSDSPHSSPLPQGAGEFAETLPQGTRGFHVRIGIHTELVVIGDIGSSEKRKILVLGETPNIAARLQNLAEPDTVVVSAGTQQLVAGLFECQDLGPQSLKGISTPLSVYQVVGEGEAHGRFEAAICALESQGIVHKEWTHKGAQSDFVHRFVSRRKIVPTSFASALPNLIRLRHTGDYRQPGVSQRQAERAVRLARKFVELLITEVWHARETP